AATRRTYLHVMPPHRQNPSGCSPATRTPRKLALRRGETREKVVLTVPARKWSSLLRTGKVPARKWPPLSRPAGTPREDVILTVRPGNLWAGKWAWFSGGEAVVRAQGFEAFDRDEAAPFVFD